MVRWVEKSHGRKDSARENIGGGEPLFSRAVELWRLFSAFAQAFEVALVHIDHAFRIFLLDEFFRLLIVERKCRQIPIFVEIPVGFHLKEFRRVEHGFRFGVRCPVAGGPFSVAVAG